jgi:PAS domain S-box-containing protein
MRVRLKNGSPRVRNEVKSASALHRSIRLAFGSVILILLVVGVSAYRAMVVSNESERWVSHTHEVLENLGDLQFSLASIESGYRGFVLTGQESFLKSYGAGVIDVNFAQANIRSLTADNPRQAPRLRTLETLANRQIHFAEMVIRLRRTEGLEVATDAIRNGEGQRVQDELKTVVSDTRGEELRLLVLRDAEAERRLGQAKSVVILGIVLALLTGTIYVWSVKREIYARAIAEKELREGEERFRTLANNISQFAWMADEKGWIFWYNERWFDYTGTTLEEMAGWGWEKVHHPEHRQRVLDRIAHCFRTGEIWEDTFPLRGRDGTYRWFLSRAVPIRDPNGSVLRWFGTNTDITERKEAEKEALRIAMERKVMEEALNLERERFSAECKLQASEASFRHLADAMPQIVFTSKPDGSLDYYNQRWFDYTGMTFEQTRDWGWQPVLHPDDLPNTIRVWTGALKSGEPFSVEYRFKRVGDGVYRWHLGQARPIHNSQGAVERWFGTCTDIEDYKEAENKIRTMNEELEVRVRERTADLDHSVGQLAAANQELKNSSLRLERSNRELQDFASVASHDLQEPLRKVQAFGDRLKAVCDGALNTQANDYLDRMLNATRRMQSLIQDLLKFARITSQASPFLPVDLAQVTRDVLSDLEVHIAETNAQVEVGDLPTIEADAVQIHQLLQNLIGNALKFHQKGKPPGVRVFAERAGCKQTGGGVLQLVVQDDGIGFDEKYLDRIFTMFQRLHGRTEYEGTGIGLAICRKIVQRHGGDITATSTLGRGTSFLVALPVRHTIENTTLIRDGEADMRIEMPDAEVNANSTTISIHEGLL